jgi:8-oxo-dGTP pyrophosphatase MutT (NUDIX family)
MKPIPQAAALALHDGRVCLVTAKSGWRWVVPKGKIETGQTARDAAQAEAWEEAGLLGKVSASPLGSYIYAKFENLYEVQVYRLDVITIRNKWPEFRRRDRQWYTPHEAANLIHESELRQILMDATADILAATA